jgi:hypothetical protein
VVVGIDRYGPALNRLDNAAGDARAVADLLATEYGFALLPAGTALLDEAAHFTALRAAITTSLHAADEHTRWLFFFAGHGLVVEGQGYLLPADAAPNGVDAHLALAWLLQESLHSRCGEVLIVLDACYGGRALVRNDQLSDTIPADRPGDRVRQLVTSGNPDQPVLDGGGSGHSVFTQTLLESLQGWSGIHEPDGSIRFSRLLDQLVFEVPARLRGQGLGATRQQPVGGNLAGNRLARDFVFQCVSPRLPPETVRGLRSDDPGRRRQDLVRLAVEGRRLPQLAPLAVQLATAHLWRTPEPDAGRLVTSTLRYEPVAPVRAEACRTLGALGTPAAAAALVAALDDEPAVCRAAALALGQLGLPQTSLPLLHHLGTAPEALVLDLVDAIGAIGDADSMAKALYEAKQRGCLVPFIGPDFPQALTSLTDRATVARRLARREGLPLGDSLAQIAGQTVGGGSRHAFTAFLKRELDDPSVQPGAIYTALAALDLPFWISGAYDSLLVRALQANQIVTGEDTQYWRPGRPVVVRLVGSLEQTRGLVVLAEDYETLRDSEGDRRLLLSYLHRELAGKVVLFLGYDPRSPDFALLVAHVLNHHLAAVDMRAFLVWPGAFSTHEWNSHKIWAIPQEPLAFVETLSAGVV